MPFAAEITPSIEFYRHLRNHKIYLVVEEEDRATKLVFPNNEVKRILHNSSQMSDFDGPFELEPAQYEELSRQQMESYIRSLEHNNATLKTVAEPLPRFGEPKVKWSSAQLIFYKDKIGHLSDDSFFECHVDGHGSFVMDKATFSHLFSGVANSHAYNVNPRHYEFSQLPEEIIQLRHRQEERLKLEQEIKTNELIMVKAREIIPLLKDNLLAIETA